MFQRLLPFKDFIYTGYASTYIMPNNLKLKKKKKQKKNKNKQTNKKKNNNKNDDEKSCQV